MSLLSRFFFFTIPILSDHMAHLWDTKAAGGEIFCVFFQLLLKGADIRRDAG